MLTLCTGSSAAFAQADPAPQAPPSDAASTPPEAAPFTPPDATAPPAEPSAPAPSAPSHTAPGYTAPGHTAPGYTAPAYTAPAYTTPGYTAPVATGPSTRASSFGGYDSERDPDPRVQNAHADRVMILPTGYTHPGGTFYLSSYDIAILQLGYAISDDAQISLTGTPPLGEDSIMPLDLSLKVVAYRDRAVRLAAVGAVTGLVGLEEGNFFLGRVGGVAQLCFDAPCESSANLGATALLAGPATLTLAGVGFIWRVAKWAAFLLEIDTLIPLGTEAGEYNGIAVLPGFRLPYRTWSLDLGVVRPLDAEEEPEPAVIPFVAFTYRFLP